MKAVPMLQILVPVSTYPTPPKAEQLAAIAAAAKGLGGDLEVLVHEVVTPQVASALGRALIDVASLRKEIEDRCREERQECRRGTGRPREEKRPQASQPRDCCLPGGFLD